MKKINDYAWRDLPKFSEKNLNPVDSLIFSQLSYLEFGKFFENDNEKIPLKDFLRIERFEHLLSNAWDHKLNKDLLFGVGMNKRFRDVYVYKCRSITSKENDEQFFAVTFIIDDNLSYIAFRGTDTSVVGWKEDFNMAYMMPVPSQTHALRYLD